jgi:hypothetical protein
LFEANIKIKTGPKGNWAGGGGGEGVGEINFWWKSRVKLYGVYGCTHALKQTADAHYSIQNPHARLFHSS